MVLNTKFKSQTGQRLVCFSDVVRLSDGKQTTVHVVRYLKKAYRLQLVFFDKARRLADWCEQNDVHEAVNGGYYLRSRNKILGEGWSNGLKLPAIAFPMPWSTSRGCIYLSKMGNIEIAARNEISPYPEGDLLQTGPLLVRYGVSTFEKDSDPEGFSETAFQHDEDINSKRFPRMAIGMNDKYIWTVSADGRSQEDAGLYLGELAKIMVMLGADRALNLDGGRCVTHISGSGIINVPRSDYTALKKGYKIHNAVIFVKK